jgi:hypothetical protein
MKGHSYSPNDPSDSHVSPHVHYLYPQKEQ